MGAPLWATQVRDPEFGASVLGSESETPALGLGTEAERKGIKGSGDPERTLQTHQDAAQHPDRAASSAPAAAQESVLRAGKSSQGHPGGVRDWEGGAEDHIWRF